MRGEPGDAYFNALDKVYTGRIPSGADLVAYWFEKARAHIEAGKLQAAGLPPIRRGIFRAPALPWDGIQPFCWNCG
jgi:hypothetical protein